MSKLSVSDLKSFLKTSSFWKNFMITIVLSVLLFYLVIKLMALSTNQGEYIKIPNLLDQKVSSVPQIINDLQISYEIIDSVYNPKQEPGLVIKQEPEPGEFIKANRKIYLYITTLTPPKIKMPKLVDRSLRQATFMIESYGLRLGKVKYIADACKNCVLNQRYQGKEILPNDTIRKGSFIELWVGKGQSDASILVPSISGLTYCEAKKRLNSLSLNIGSVICNHEITDTCNAIIVRQIPEPGEENMINLGSVIDVFLSRQQ